MIDMNAGNTLLVKRRLQTLFLKPAVLAERFGEQPLISDLCNT